MAIHLYYVDWHIIFVPGMIVTPHKSEPEDNLSTSPTQTTETSKFSTSHRPVFQKRIVEVTYKVTGMSWVLNYNSYTGLGNHNVNFKKVFQ